MKCTNQVVLSPATGAEREQYKHHDKVTWSKQQTVVIFFLNVYSLAYWISLIFYGHLFECHLQQQILIVDNAEFPGL